MYHIFKLKFKNYIFKNKQKWAKNNEGNFEQPTNKQGVSCMSFFSLSQSN